MSIRFLRSSSQSVYSVSAIPALSYPIIVSLEFQPNDLTAEQVILSICDDDGDDYHAIVFDAATATKRIKARTRASGTSSDATSTLAIGSTDPVRVLAIWESDSSRSIYVNGDNLGTNTDTRSPSGLDKIQISGRNATLYASADVAEVAIWSATTLTTAELGELNIGVHPLLVSPGTLAIYTPLGAITPNPFLDEINHTSFFLSGAPTLSSMGSGMVGYAEPILSPPPVNVINITVELLLALGQEIDTNLPHGYPSNSFTLSHEVLNNIIQETISDSLAFSHETLNNIIEESLTSAFVLTVEANHNIVEDSASNTFYLGNLATHNIRTRAASIDLAFSQLVETNIFELTVSTDFGFSLFAGTVKEASISQNLSFLQAGWDTSYPFTLESTFGLGQLVSTNGTIRSFSLSDIIYLSQSAGQTFEGSATTPVSFTNEATRGDSGNSELTFSVAASGEPSKFASSLLNLFVDLGLQREFTISVETDLDFAQGSSTYQDPDGSCDLASFNATGGNLTPPTLSSNDSITLVCGMDTLTLKNPTFGNSDEYTLNRAYNKSRGLQPCAFRNPIWPRAQTKRFTVTDICDSDAEDIVAFKRTCAGKEVTYTDMEDRDWVGYLVGFDPVVDNGINRKEVSFEFLGVLAAEKTW